MSLTPPVAGYFQQREDRKGSSSSSEENVLKQEKKDKRASKSKRRQQIDEESLFKDPSTLVEALDLDGDREITSKPTHLTYLIRSGNNASVIARAMKARSDWEPYSDHSRATLGATPTPRSKVPNKSFDHQLGIKLPPDFIWEMDSHEERYTDPIFKDAVYNHLEYSTCLTNKVGLHRTLQAYCREHGIDQFSFTPYTFYIKNAVAPPFSVSTSPTKYRTSTCDSKLRRSDSSASDELSSFLAYAILLQSKITQTNAESPTKPSSISGGGGQSNLASLSDSKSINALHCSPAENLRSMGTPFSTKRRGSSNRETTQASSGRKSSKMDESTTTWIVKPATDSNRGVGIKVCKGVKNVLSVTEKQLQYSLLNRKTNQKTIIKSDGWIVQSYIERPLLVHGRKFDIRCFVLVTLECLPKTSVGGHGGWQVLSPTAQSTSLGETPPQQESILRGYYYRDAYVRTSSVPYSLDDMGDLECHLTNDAVQKNSEGYGRFEGANKLSLDELQEAISLEYPGQARDVVATKVVPEIKRICELSLRAAAPTLTTSSMTRTFELFGYDYMLDEDCNPILIEVNDKPCLELVCPLVEGLITNLIDKTLALVIDPFAQGRTQGGTGTGRHVSGDGSSNTVNLASLSEAEAEERREKGPDDLSDLSSGYFEEILSLSCTPGSMPRITRHQKNVTRVRK